jgi:hypothetical protein
MLAHDLAKLLLEQPNLEVHSDDSCMFQPKVEEILDTDHPNFQDFDSDLGDRHDTTPDGPWVKYWNAQPKKKVVMI